MQKSGDAVRVNVQLIKAANDSHLWADTFDRKLTDIFAVESDVAKAIADLYAGNADRSGRGSHRPASQRTILRLTMPTCVAWPMTQNDGHMAPPTPRRQVVSKEAVRLDAKFALAWALLSCRCARLHRSESSTDGRSAEETRQAAETALTLQPNLGEALLAKGYYHYACLKEYDTAVRYFEQARQFLPNSSRIPESLANVARRRAQWDRSESYFNEAERLDPRNVNLLIQHAATYVQLRRFTEALRKLDQILDIAPDDVTTLVYKASIAQGEGDLPRASALLTPLQPAADDRIAWRIRTYQAILERRPAQIIPRLKEIWGNPDPAVGYINPELRFWLGWAQEIAGDHAAARDTWRGSGANRNRFSKNSQTIPGSWEISR